MIGPDRDERLTEHRGERVEHLGQQRVVRGRHDRAVEGQVGLDEAGLLAVGALPLRQACSQGRDVRAGANFGTRFFCGGGKSGKLRAIRRPRGVSK